MGIFDKVREVADKALKSANEAKDKATEIYKKEGFEGFLDRADKVAEKVENKSNDVMDKAVSYAKGINESNKKEIAKAKNKSKDDFDKVVNVSVAATVNTVTTVAKDVADQAKKIVDKAIGEKKEKPLSKLDFERFVEADQVSLLDVVKFVGAKQDPQDKDVYKNSYGHNIRIKGHTWLDQKTSKSGSGAVSLLKHELNIAYTSSDKVKDDKALEKEAVGILDKISTNNKVAQLQKVAEPIVEQPKVPVKKAAKKVASKKTPAKKSVEKTEEVELPIKKTPAKRTTAKKTLKP